MTNNATPTDYRVGDFVPDLVVPKRSSQINWRARIAEAMVAPGEWMLAAEDVTANTPSRLKRVYGIEAHGRETNALNTRVAKLFIRWPSDRPIPASHKSRIIRLREERGLPALPPEAFEQEA